MMKLGIVATALTLSGCASTGAIPTPFPQPGGSQLARTSSPRATTADGYAIAGTALALRGTPYRDGGIDPSGFDCSGFVRYVFAQHGIAVPRSVAELFQLGNTIDPNDLQSGDLLFFSISPAGVSHVAIAIGGEEFVHAPKTGGEVRVERISSGYWSPRFVAARRLF